MKNKLRIFFIVVLVVNIIFIQNIFAKTVIVYKPGGPSEYEVIEDTGKPSTPSKDTGSSTNDSTESQETHSPPNYVSELEKNKTQIENLKSETSNLRSIFVNFIKKPVTNITVIKDFFLTTNKDTTFPAEKTESLENGDTQRESEQETEKSNAEQKTQEDKQIKNSQTAGDPVRISNGEYIQKENDISIRFASMTFESNGIFEINRTYETNNSITGSLGKGWSTNIDSRIIVGIDKDARERSELYKKEVVEQLRQGIDNYKQYLCSLFNTLELDEAQNTGNQKIILLENLNQKASMYLSQARYNKELCHGTSYYQESENIYDDANKLSEEIKTIISIYKNELYSLPITLEKISNLEVEYQKSEKEYYRLCKIADNCDKIIQKNQHSYFDGMDISALKIGYGNISLIDENGVTLIFSSQKSSATSDLSNFPFEEVVFFPIDEATSKYSQIKSNSHGSFIATLKNGYVEHFGTTGFITSTSDRNGNTVNISRESNGKIKEIFTSSGEKYKFEYDSTNKNFISKISNTRNSEEKCIFSYEDNFLTSVKDNDGDIVRYEYKQIDNRKLISKIVKNDGSIISFSYELKNDDGSFKTTKTTNEENYSEVFDYETSNNLTLYTDHDGCKNYYWFDENHNIVRELFSDGRENKYIYNKDGLLSQKSENGFITDYVYDNSGNIIQYTFNGMATGKLKYDKYGNIVEYIDSDGIKQTIERDNKGNPILLKKGDIVSKKIVYNDKGQIVRTISENENHSISSGTETQEYEYDKYANLISTSYNGKVFKYTYDNQNRLKTKSINGILVSSYEYLNHKIKETTHTGLETIYTYNNRKDLIDKTQIDTKTNQKRITVQFFDKRHLVTKREIFDEIISQTGKTEKKLAFSERFFYTPTGKLSAAMQIDCNTNQSCYVTIFEYADKNNVVTPNITNIKKFKIDNNLSSGENGFIQNKATENVSYNDITYEELLNMSKKSANVSEIKYSVKYSDGQNEIAITNSLGTTERLVNDLNKGIQKHINALGEETITKTTAANRILKSQNSYGGFYEYSYDVMGNISAINTSMQNIINISYTANGNIASITYITGETINYTYNAENQIINITTIEKDGIIKKQIYEYDFLGRLISETNIDNRKESTEFSATYKYDDKNRTITQTMGGIYKKTYQLNAYDEIIAIVNGSDSIDVDGADDENIISSSLERNAIGQITSVSDGYGNKTLYNYNALGKVSQIIFPDKNEKHYEYDHLGNLVKTYIGKNTESGSILYSAKYDTQGRIISEITNNGNVNTYAYDELDRIIAVKNGNILIQKIQYQNRGKSIIVTDGNGNNYKYIFDDFGRLIEETNRLGKKQFYTYDIHGNIISKIDFNGNTINYSKTAWFSSDSEKNNLKYNNIGSIMEQENISCSHKYKYDAGGLLIEEKDEESGEMSYYKYNPAGNKILSKNSTSFLSYTYGKNGELLSVFDNKSRLQAKFTYDKLGREIQRTYGSGVSQEKIYDNSSRIILIIEKTSKNTINWLEGYMYDAFGRCCAKINETGLITRYEYDKQGRLSKVFYPESSEIKNLHAREAKENGLIETISNVDSRNVLETQGHAENSFLTATEIQTFSSLLNRASYTLGNIISPLQVFRSESFTYDNNGNRITKTTSFGTIEYTYDAENHLISSGTSNKPFIQYKYDDNGNMITRETSEKLESYAYNYQNRMTSYSLSLNEVKTPSQSDPTLRYRSDSELSTNNLESPQWKQIQNKSYKYDAFGRRIAMQSTNNSTNNVVEIGYIYDGLSFNIIKESPLFKSGLFTDKANTGIDFIDEDISSGVSTREESTSFTDTSTSQNTNGERYRYITDENISSSRTSPVFETTDHILLHGHDQLEERNFLYVNNEIIGISSDKNHLYFGTDILGSTRSITNFYGDEISQFEYDAFGMPLSEIFYKTENKINFGYLGKEYDYTSGLYNYGFREYSPAIARFSTIDPIRDGTNWFSYCDGDPINFVDLWGLELGNRTSHNIMNEGPWINELTGYGVEGEKLSSTGCAITEMSNILSSYLNKTITPSDINNDKSNFNIEIHETKEKKTESVLTDNLLMKKVGEDYGLKYDYWTRDVQKDLTPKLKELKNSELTFFISAQVKYAEAQKTDEKGNEITTESYHWVGVSDIVEIDNKPYIKISPTSKFDTSKPSRKLDSWKIHDDGSMLIEIREINKIYTYEVPNNKGK